MDSRTEQVPAPGPETAAGDAPDQAAAAGGDTEPLRRSGLARLSSKVGQKLWGVVHDEADEAAAKAALGSRAGVWLFRGFVAALLVGLVLAAAGVI